MTCEINSKYFQGYRPAKQEEKDSGINKSTNALLIDISSGKYLQQSFIHQSRTSKKNQDHQQGSQCRRRQKQGCSNDFFAKGTNANVIKKEGKNISQIKYFKYKKKGHYSNKYPLNLKKESKKKCQSRQSPYR